MTTYFFEGENKVMLEDEEESYINVFTKMNEIGTEDKLEVKPVKEINFNMFDD